MEYTPGYACPEYPVLPSYKSTQFCPVIEYLVYRVVHTVAA
jgi:hypothetical protein